MEEIKITENNKKNSYKKIPLVILLLVLLGGIFLIVCFFSFYHQDSIDDFIFENVSFYSHWQTKKIVKSNRFEKIFNKLNSNEKIQKILPNNFEQKLENSSELAIVFFNDKWIYIYKPINDEIFENNLFKYKNYIIETNDYSNILKIVNESKSLSKNDLYQKQKRLDTSIINIFSANFSDLDVWNNLSDKTLLPHQFFGKVNIENNEIFIAAKTNKLTNDFYCANNIENVQIDHYKFYINNLSAKNELLKNIAFLKNTNMCLDIAFFSNNQWAILIPKNKIKPIKENISEYLALKYPAEKAHKLPDNSEAIHFIADIELYKWNENNNILNCGNDQEKYFIKDNDDFFILANDEKITNKQIIADNHKFTHCEKNGIINTVKIKYPEKLLFNEIILSQSQSSTFICIH